MALDRIFVVAHPRIGQRVALAEKHSEHPLNEYGEHEVYVAAGTGPVEVAITPEVNRLLAPTDGSLIAVSGAVLAEVRDKHAADLEARKLRREGLLLEQRQAETDRIGETQKRARELELQVAELEARLDGTLAVASAQNAADESTRRHEDAIATAQAQADAVRAASEQSAASAPRDEAEAQSSGRRAAARTATPDASGENAPAETGSAESAVANAERPKR